MTEAEWRKRLKAAHICRDCGKQDAYTLGGRTYCAECAERHSAAKRKWRQEEVNRESDSEAQKRIRAMRANAGLCVYCGKRKIDAGRKVCEICSSKQSRKRHDRRIAEGMNWPRGANGYCWLCNKRKAVDGKRLCQPCIDNRMKNLSPEAAARGREAQRMGGRNVQL